MYQKTVNLSNDDDDDDNDDDDDIGLKVLGCRADILGTNCNRLIKLKINAWMGGGGGGICVALQSAIKQPTTMHQKTVTLCNTAIGN